MTGVLLRLTLLGLMPMILTGCLSMQTRSTGIVVDTTCEAMRPITYSASRDTPETVREVRQHNAAYQALCGQ